MSVIPTESNINMTGAGLVGKSTSGTGKSGRMDSVSVLSWLGLSASGVTDGKALIASSNAITWSPSAAALLPDTLPAVGTLLSYGGSRQLAEGGNVSHAGNITLTGGANGIYISPSGVNKGLIYFSAGQNRLYGQPAVPWVIESDAGFKVRNSANSADAALTAGAITSSGTVSIDDGSAFGVLNLTTTAGRTGQIKHNGTLVAQLTAYSSDITFYKPVSLSGNALTAGTVSATSLTLNPASLPVSLGYETYIGQGRLASNNYARFGLLSVGYNALFQRAFMGGTGGWSDNLVLGAGYNLQFSSLTQGEPHTLQAAVDVSLSRDSAGVLGIYTDSTKTTKGALTCGAITASGTVLPASSGSQALGSTSAYWGTLHLTTLRSAGAINVNTAGTGYGAFSFGSNGYLDADQLSIRSNNQVSTRLVVSSSSVTSTIPLAWTPQQSSLNPTTIDIPSGRRVSWYNSTLAEFRDWVNIGGTLLKSAAYT